MSFHKKKLTYVLVGVAALIIIIFATPLAGYLHYKALYMMYGKECGRTPNCNSSHPILGPVVRDREAQRGAGAHTYGFKKLVIYYTHFTHPDQQRATGYPELLKFENFDALLIETVKKRFVKCLTDKSGDLKPVVSYADGRNRRDRNYEMESSVQEEVTNPDNLVLFLDVDYSLYPAWPKDEKPYARMMYNFYRPGLSGWEAVLPFRISRGSRIIYPSDGDEVLRVHLVTFFSSMTPVGCRDLSSNIAITF